jgi:hypothetical protein
MGDIDEIFLQTGGAKPNRSPHGDCPVEDTAALPRENQSLAASITAKFGSGPRFFHAMTPSL